MVETIKIGIVEDQVIIADTIIATLEDLGYHTTEPAMSYRQAIEMIEEETPDLILLDIQLIGKKSGIDVARTINQKYNIPFIFLTSNADSSTVQQAKEENPQAYLVKPFSNDDLFTAIEIALANFNKIQTPTIAKQEKKTIFLKKKQLFYAIDFEDILFIKSDAAYVEINTTDNRFIHRITLDLLLQKVPDSLFIRVHRRYIININTIKAIGSDYVLIKGDHKIPVSKSHKMKLLEYVKFL